MTTNTIEVLQAGINRLMEHRKELRIVQTLMRVWPDVVNFSCNVVPRGVEGEPIPDESKAEERFQIPRDVALEASGFVNVPWDELRTLDVEGVRAIADRVCAKAHALLDPLLKPKLDA